MKKIIFVFEQLAKQKKTNIEDDKNYLLVKKQPKNNKYSMFT